jgi:hypothetical protein
MKRTVAMVLLTVVSACLAAHHARGPEPASASDPIDALARHVQVEVGSTTTTVTIDTPRPLAEALELR